MRQGPRRLVESGTDDEVGPCGAEGQGDVRAVGDAGDMDRLTAYHFEQLCEVRSILRPAARTGAGLAAGVTTPIAHHHPVPLGK